MYPTPRLRPASPRLEALEDRVLLSGSPVGKAAVTVGPAQFPVARAESTTSHAKKLGKFLTHLLVGDNCGCGVNRPPVAVADQATTLTGKPVSISVLANDKDPEGGPLTLVSVGSAAGGAVKLDQAKPGVVLYTPKPGFKGEDCFTYTVRDSGGKTASASVKVKVNAPTPTPSTANRPPVARDDKVTAHAGKTVWVNVLGNDRDPDGDALTIAGVTQPAKGTVRIDSGKVVYTPRQAFVGTDRFTYTVRDARGATSTASVVIEYGNKPPVAVADLSLVRINQAAVTIDVLANDTDPDGDALTVTTFVATTARGGQVKRDPANANRLVYTPPKGYGGEDYFTYKVSDGLGGVAEACVRLVIAQPWCGTPPPIPPEPMPVSTCQWFGEEELVGC